MAGMYEQVGSVLRITRHDGLPRMVLDALGKHVVYSWPFDGCYLARTADEVCSALVEIGRKDGRNTDGAEVIARDFSAAKRAGQLERAFAGLERGRMRRVALGFYEVIRNALWAGRCDALADVPAGEDRWRVRQALSRLLSRLIGRVRPQPPGRLGRRHD